MLQSSDTHPEVEEIQISLIRKASVAKRISRMRSLSQTVIHLSRRAVLRVNPELSGKELKCKLIAHLYGNDLADRFHNYLKHKTP
jgi:hypothetical protein